MHPPRKRYVRELHDRNQNLNSSNDHRHAISKFVSLHVVVFWVMTACILVGSVFVILRNIMFYVCMPFVFRKVGTQATGLQGVLSFLTAFIESIESDIPNPPSLLWRSGWQARIVIVKLFRKAVKVDPV